MSELPFLHPSIDWLGAAVGIALLLFGRKLYWLALGGLGFLLGLLVAREVLDLQSHGQELLIALLLGVVGAVLAVQAQKIAIAIGGFVLGGGLVLWLAERLDSEPDLRLLAFVLLGAVIGFLLARRLFEAALVAVTVLVGAGLVVNASHLGIQEQPWLFLPLVLVGVIWQSGSRRRRRA